MHITRWKSDMLCDSNHVSFRDHVESRGGGRNRRGTQDVQGGDTMLPDAVRDGGHRSSHVRANP